MHASRPPLYIDDRIDKNTEHSRSQSAHLAGSTSTLRRQGENHMRYAAVFISILGTLCSAMVACKTGPSEPGSALLPSRDRLRATFGTDELNGCDNSFQPDWPFPGAQRNLRLLRIQSKNVLVYDLVTRNSTRTIWQPLAKDYSFDGAGRAIGKVDKGALTLDFNMHEGARGSLWVGYRFRYPTKAFAAAQIEWLPPHIDPVTQPNTDNQSTKTPSKLVTIPLKSGPHDSVQNMWVLPGHDNKPWEADVITRSYRFKPDTLASDWQESDASTLFSWYRVDGRAGIARLQDSYVDDVRSIEAVQFVQLDDSAPPVAVAVEHDNAGPQTGPKRLSRITLRQLFVKGATSTELYSVPDAVLANLDALVVPQAPPSCVDGTSQPAQNNGCSTSAPQNKASEKKLDAGPQLKITAPRKRLAIAWTRTSEDDPGVVVHWLDVPVPDPRATAMAPFGLQQNSVVAKASQRQGYAKTGYPPVALKLHNVSAKSKGSDGSVYLTWTATTASETAFLSLPLTNPQLTPGTENRQGPSLEKTDPQAYIVQKEALMYLGTAVQSEPNAVALVLFRELSPGQTPNSGPRLAGLDPGRLPVQICSVSLRSKASSTAQPSPTDPGTSP